MKLIPIETEDFEAIYAEMERAFVLEERRDFAPARELLQNPLYTVYHLEADGLRIGFVCIWKLDGWAFIEHFVVYEAYRNRGFGAEVLRVIKREFPQLVLEVERPETEIAARRIGFYERCGFSQNPYPYRQPSYRGVGGELDMILMTYPAPCPNCKELVRLLYDCVYHVPLAE